MDVFDRARSWSESATTKGIESIIIFRAVDRDVIQFPETVKIGVWKDGDPLVVVCCWQLGAEFVRVEFDGNIPSRDFACCWVEALDVDDSQGLEYARRHVLVD